MNNFWKYLAADPALLKRTWETQKAILAPGAIDPLVKEMIYLAVSVTNSCSYGIACHTALARKAGMTDAMFGELMAVIGMANQTIGSLMDFACRSMTPSTFSAYAPSRRLERARLDAGTISCTRPAPAGSGQRRPAN